MIIAGCGASKPGPASGGSGSSGSGGSTPTATNPGVTLSASPASVAAGGSSTLTIAATNATAVTVTGTDGSSYTLAPAGGTQVVTPKATTAYTATATGAAGTTAATATATVTVTTSGGSGGTTPPAAPTVTITANPTSVDVGSQSTLTVAATNATAITITGSDKTSYTLPGTGGTQSVSPTATTTYTATATGATGTTPVTATATVTVTPNPAPTLTLTASPMSITAGSSASLIATAVNATTVTITGTDKSSYSLTSTGGTQPVTPQTTTTYTATATGNGGTATQTVTITVQAIPLPTVTISANPQSVTSGTSSTLTVSAINATSATITGSDGSTYPLDSASTPQVVTPTTTTTYTITGVGPGGTSTASTTVTVTPVPTPTVSITASPTTIVSGNNAVLNIVASNASAITVTGSGGDSNTYNIPTTGGTQTVTPTSTTVYTVTAIGTGNSSTKATSAITITVTPASAANGVNNINHVIFMLQENHTFDNYFGMLNPYRQANGFTTSEDGNSYAVDGIDDKLNTISNQDDEGNSYKLFPMKSTCVDDETSSWLESYGQVNRYDFSTTRSINMDGFVHTAEGFAKSCSAGATECAGTFSDLAGQRAMAYYDQNYLNYYYYMASQFALSDRWFSPISSKTIDNRIATLTGGTTQGLAFDPGNDDGLPQLAIQSIFNELTKNSVSWKIYYTVTQGSCLDEDDCPATPNARYPATNYSSLSDSGQYITKMPSNGVCPTPLISSNDPVVNDSDGTFCIDINHIAPLSQYYVDLKNGTLPSFVFIEPGYGVNDEHPGSGQSILQGQTEVSNIVNALMGSTSWHDSVFFLGYDEAGGPYEHVPPVPKHSNDNTDAMVGNVAKANIPDIGSIAVNPDAYPPCLPANGTPTTHCDLHTGDPGAVATDAANGANQGFSAQLGFRIPNMVISPFARKHYVSHIPMDHTAILEFVENRFIGANTHLTARDAAQPNLLDFFDFTNAPWSTPPTPPTAYTDPAGTSSCTPANFAPPGYVTPAAGSGTTSSVVTH